MTPVVTRFYPDQIRKISHREDAAHGMWFDALKVACAAAHQHIVAQPGNPGEASKREQCWKEFKNTEVPVGDAWVGELAASPFSAPASDEELLAREWEAVRHQFQNDSRTLGEFEAAGNEEDGG